MSDKKHCIFMFPGIGDNYRKYIQKWKEEDYQYLLEYAQVAKRDYEVDILADSIGSYAGSWVLNYTCDYLVYQKHKKAGMIPDYMAGYSLGAITALACAGGFEYGDGVQILKEIATYRKPAAEEQLMLVIGFTTEELKNIINKEHLTKKIFIACINNKCCLTVAGRKKELEKFERMIQQMGALKTKRIESPYAFHTDYMKEGIAIFAQNISNIAYKECSVSVISSIDQREIKSGRQVYEELIRNLYRSLNWKDTILKFENGEKRTYVDTGLTKSMIKITKLIAGEQEYMDLSYMVKKTYDEGR
ncbi:acyltransferase domain-containing protein [[Clostridium] polysaccharolyticum]|uniref:[acyl-carrier-protein] S-malonyltransferase n=1 Tax=[Clostridium] polysaccharolyticum TaxID=29364 RepID=A0A1I0EFM4_9FIRM|nr:acyltransferase domain-containing protein [[Clostridium] polysaccharolyticum]SET43251.1 Malonyl CoA-acyl carrier protein transacylase [[Clostridium] polysaccharolyticum]